MKSWSTQYMKQDGVPKYTHADPKSQMKKYLQIMSPLGRTSAGTVSGFHQHVIASDEN